MKIGIDIQSLTAPPTGVGYYTLGLLGGLAALEEPIEVVPYYFTLRGQAELPAAVYKKMAPRERRLPAGLLNLCWRRFNFPPVEWLARGMDLYHHSDCIARPTRRKPVVSTIHDLAFRRLPEFTEPGRLKTLENSLPGSLERSDRIIAVSRFTRDDLVELYRVPREKLAVVEGGVDESFRAPLTADELLRIRYRFHLPEKYLLAVGTWEPRKNLVRLLGAWEALQASGRAGDCKLVLAGAKGWLCGEIEQKFRNQAGQRGVMTLGRVPRTALPGICRSASGFVCPGLYEGRGLAALEAMASGLPLAAARAGALPELLGEAALYFDPTDQERMAEAIGALINNPELAAGLAEQGKKQAARFTWERSARLTLEVCRSAAGIGPAPG